MKTTCPFGHDCEIQTKDTHEVCAWLVEQTETNTQTGETRTTKSCAMALLPGLLIENARVSRGTSAAVESFRNESVKSQGVFNQILSRAAGLSLPNKKDFPQPRS